MRRFISISTPILACFLTGFIASLFQTDAINQWYPTLNKPQITPPDQIFPVVWSILYLCMGISIGLIINTQHHQKWFFVILFSIQLFFNFTWSISFFYLQSPLVGLINIFILDIWVVYYIISSYPWFRISSLLFLPYIVWIFFATYLNLYIFIYN